MSSNGCSSADEEGVIITEMMGMKDEEDEKYGWGPFFTSVKFFEESGPGRICVQPASSHSTLQLMAPIHPVLLFYQRH